MRLFSVQAKAPGFRTNISANNQMFVSIIYVIRPRLTDVGSKLVKIDKLEPNTVQLSSTV